MADPLPTATSTAETLAAELPADSNSAPTGGEIVAGRYELLGLLGTGAMGRVYRARDRELDELVALKVLHRDLLASEGMLARFRQEVKLARRVTHRNVARTFDIGEHAGEKFLTMELVDGEPLAAILARRGALPLADALAIASEICAGMAAAHAAGVIHRDLKPENVLVATNGRAVVTDFGVARTHLPGSVKGTSGKAIGTPAYMAPEQVEASADIDPRADVYAFGAMLFEMLTGRAAWPGDSPFVVAAARLFHPPPDPRSVRSDLPERVASIVLRCLARKRDDRWATTDDLAREIGQARAEIAGRSTGIRDQAPIVRAASEAREKTVAVLPFRNAGPTDDAYVAEGLTEDLVDVLSMVRSVRIRGRAVARPDEDAAALGRRLGVDVVVEGSVRRIGEQVRVSARVVGSEDGFQIWSARFQKALADAFALNDEVAQAIASALSATASAPIRAMPTNPLAVDLYLRARHESSLVWMQDATAALAVWERALEVAPDDPTILAGFVSARGRHAFLGGAEIWDRLDTLVERAIRLGPHLPDPWHALAMFRLNARDDAAGAVRALRRAIENAPSFADGHDLAGRILLESGDLGTATAELERALWLDPMIPWARVDLMRAYAFRNRLDRVAEVASVRSDDAWRGHRAVSLARISMWWRRPVDGDEATLPEPHATIAKTYASVVETKRYDPSESALIKIMRDRATPNSRGARLVEQLEAEFRAFLGADDLARHHIERSVAEGLRDLVWLDHVPLFEPYRREPWFSEARAVVAARSKPTLEAWLGPPEALPGP